MLSICSIVVKVCVRTSVKRAENFFTSMVLISKIGKHEGNQYIRRHLSKFNLPTPTLAWNGQGLVIVTRARHED